VDFFAELPAAVLITDLDGRIKAINPAMRVRRGDVRFLVGSVNGWFPDTRQPDLSPNTCLAQAVPVPGCFRVIFLPAGSRRETHSGDARRQGNL